MFFDAVQGAFFQAAYLRLADSDFSGNLNLGLSVKVAHGNDPSFPWGKGFYRITEHDVAYPTFLPGGIMQLIYNGKAVFSIRVNRFI